MEGEVKGEMVPHFLVQSDANVSQWYTYEKNRPATSNQSALFMMSINRYYVKCLLYSVDSTASQQPASLQLQHIEDTSNDSTFMDDVTSYSYNLNFVHPQGK